MPPTPIAAFPKEKLDRCGYLLALKASADAEPWHAELKDLVAQVRSHYAKAPADIPVRAEGNLYFIDLTKREMERSVSNKKRAFDALKKAMGITALIEAITMTFKLLDAHIAPADQGTFVTQGRTGNRDVSAVLKNATEVKSVKAA